MAAGCKRRASFENSISIPIAAALQLIRMLTLMAVSDAVVLIFPMAIRGTNRAQFEQTLPKLLTPTTPIRSIEFLRGRDKILEVIRRAFIQPGRNVFIYGDRGVGKTSLAQTAAMEHQSADNRPVFVGCDNASTFYGTARTIAQRLKPGDPTVNKITRSGKVGGGWKGFISAEAQQTIERGGIPTFSSVDDVISVLSFLAQKHSEQLWTWQLSITTMSLRRSVGTKHCST
jgi:Cdc6-like AAA superfamily ATPase